VGQRRRGRPGRGRRRQGVGEEERRLCRAGPGRGASSFARFALSTLSCSVRREQTSSEARIDLPGHPQKAASTLVPLLPSLHPTALSRLYTLRTFRDKLGGLSLPGVTLSEGDCAVLATYLSRKGECAFDGEVRRGIRALVETAAAVTMALPADVNEPVLLRRSSSLLRRTRHHPPHSASPTRTAPP